MIHFLRKLRHSLIQGEGMKKYILYAIGEIMLVVIGILIALQIDDWNEERKDQENLAAIFEIISNDLKIDSLKFFKTINTYEVRTRKLNKIIVEQVSDQELFESLALIDSYDPMTLNLKGINLLRDHSSSRLSIDDSLITQTLEMYSFYEKLIPIYSKRTEDDIFQNFSEWKQNENWFSTYTLETFDIDTNLNLNQAAFASNFLNYARRDHNYKNKVGMFYAIITIDKQLLRGFNNYAKFLLTKINQRYGFE